MSIVDDLPPCGGCENPVAQCTCDLTTVLAASIAHVEAARAAKHCPDCGEPPAECACMDIGRAVLTFPYEAEAGA